MKFFYKDAFLFFVGGSLYLIIELLWRGSTHISMFVVGAIGFMIVGSLNECYTYQMSLLKQGLISCFMVTLVELVAGIILNIILKFNVWDYSDLQCNFMGQISLLYSFYWFLLSYVGIFLDDFIRWKYFNEEKPNYVIF